MRKELPGVRLDALSMSARLQLWARCMCDLYTYGDGVSLCAASIMYRTRIYVVSDNLQHQTVIIGVPNMWRGSSYNDWAAIYLKLDREH